MHHVIRLIAAILVFAGTASALAAQARAGVADMTCSVPSSEVITFSPALTSAPEETTISVTSEYGPCVSLSQPGITSGTASFTTTAVRSCIGLLNASPSTRVITWNTGQISTLSGSATVNIVGATLIATITGNVTAGLFEGDSFVYTVAAPATSILECTIGLGTVSSIGGLVDLEITSA
jgi:hypothetical protein